MTTVAPTGFSSFGVVAEAEQQILTSQNEEMKAAKTSVKYKEKVLEKSREERIENLQDRIKSLASGHSGCLKFLKIITFVASVVTIPFTGGASLTLAAAVSAILAAVGGIVSGVGQLLDALQQKKLILNQAQGQQILAIMQETKKWIEDEQNILKEASEDQKQTLEGFKMTLNDLEESFSAMVNIEERSAT